ncbi:NlpC/P60 family protein [Lentzea sp. NPDC051838]|uniref:C40 family peptidase n=1 Tax=Lentzea sp. NPDC051838 TaxID=3154849 RepID=UPI00341F56A0
MAAIAVAAATHVAPAAADPPLPPNASEALKKYTELAGQAEKLNEEHLRAQDDLKAKEAELGTARQAEQSLRGQVDALTEATFKGATFNQLSALLVSDSQQDFLNRMSALNILAADNAEALGKLAEAVAQADNAARQAQEAVATIAARKSELDGQVTLARQQYNQLNATERGVLSNGGDMSKISVPAGTAGKALEYALAQRGDQYVFGANGPDAWDCSSLMQASYRTAGVQIPRTTYGQAGVGRPVSRSEVKAGDLIIYYADQHHVAMAVDNLRAVHASTEGVPVKIADIDSIGPISVIRRLEG